MRTTALFAIVFVWLVRFASAQEVLAVVPPLESRSLEEITQWLTRNSSVMAHPWYKSGNPRSKITWRYDNYTFSWNECRVDTSHTSSMERYWRGEVKETSTTQYLESFSLKDMDPARVDVQVTQLSDSHKGTTDVYRVFLTTTQEQTLVQVKKRKDGGSLTVASPTSSFSHGAPNKEMAERMANAWQHAIQLCGGKETSEPS